MKAHHHFLSMTTFNLLPLPPLQQQPPFDVATATHRKQKLYLKDILLNKKSLVFTGRAEFPFVKLWLMKERQEECKTQ